MTTRTDAAAGRGLPGRPGRARRRAGLGAAVAAGALVLATACGAAVDEGGRAVRVEAAFYPLQFVVERVGGDRVTVESLTPPGVDSHHLELSPARVREIGSADLVVFLSGFQPATDEAVAAHPALAAVDVAEVADLRAGDPHIWLDPARLAAVGERVAERLAEVDPDGAEAYAAGARALAADLEELDEEYAAALTGCAGATLVTAHAAFGYLAERYGLEQVGITGIDPEAEASPARLREVGEIVRERGVRTLYFEVLTSPKVTQLLADDLGVSTDVLDPLENRSDPAADYLDVMRANLDALERGLACP